MQRLNSRRYNQPNLDEGKNYIQNGEIPVRLQNYRQRQAFIEKWRGAEIINEQIVIDGREIVAEEDVDSILKQAYANPLEEGGRDKLHHRLLGKYIGISRNKVMNFLRNQEAWQLHQPAPKPSVQQASVISGPFVHWQIDLIDMSTLAKYNNNDHFLLTCIDTFSKFAYSRTLKDKSGPAVVKEMEIILAASPRLPAVIQCDNGKEFITKQLNRLLTRLKIKLIFSSSYSPQSNGGIERFNGSLKRMIHRHLTQFSTRKYNDVLPLVLQNYNTAKHSSTGFAPTELQQAYMEDNKEILSKSFERLTTRAIKMLTPEITNPIIKKGDTVRISIHTMKDVRKQTFRKTYLANWSKDVYTVSSISRGSEWQNPQYKLKNMHEHAIRQRFYRKDLQKVDIETLTINEQKRPDYSGGGIFNQEEHIRKVIREGPQRTIIKPPTQAQEREKGLRAIKPRKRLIDELIIQAAIQKKRESLKKHIKDKPTGKTKE